MKAWGIPKIAQQLLAVFLVSALLPSIGNALYINYVDGLLIDAASRGNLALVKALVDNGADVNARCNEGMTALMKSADSGHFEVVKLLLTKSGDINVEDKDGWTALDLAQEKGHKEIAELLKARGAKE